MKKLNWGQLPLREDFERAFERELGEKLYEIRHGSLSDDDGLRPAAGDYTCRELWVELGRLVELDNEVADGWASDILSTLGFEWV